jgi:hypothetical protein
MPKIDNLFIVQGEYINKEYDINGNKVKLFDDNANYWGTQVPKQGAEERFFGVACDEKTIVVSEYGKDCADLELVMIKRR